MAARHLPVRGGKDGWSPGRAVRRRVVFWGAGIASAGTLAAVALQRPARALTGTREIADMTWIEVRDAVAAGFCTVLVPTGGIEQNGPHMITGKHDRIVAWAARRIAAELGNALVAPVVSYVPQGTYDPPTGNMQWPGTLGIPPDVFAGVLEGIARSLRAAGFAAVCFLSDHGESQAPQAAVAARLTAEWGTRGPAVLSIDSYYAWAAEDAYLRAQGETTETIGQHATISDTSELMAVWPAGVDLSRVAPGQGSSGAPGRATIARGDALMRLKVEAAVAQIRAALGTGGQG